MTDFLPCPGQWIDGGSDPKTSRRPTTKTTVIIGALVIGALIVAGGLHRAKDNAAAFPDVPFGAPFHADIDWMAEAKITTGYPDGTFHPGGSVPRQAMAAFLYRFKGSPDGAHPTCSSAPYVDVPVESPFCGEISWMKTAGITTGYPDGSFHPADGVQRQAMAAFLYRFDANPNGANPACAVAPFADVPTDSPFCGEITWLKTAAISTGNADGTFSPTAFISRQAMAAFLHRLSLLRSR